MAKKTHGRVRSGEPITDALVEELVAKQAEEGFDVDEILRRRGGRPRWARLPPPSSRYAWTRS